MTETHDTYILYKHEIVFGNLCSLRICVEFFFFFSIYLFILFFFFFARDLVHGVVVVVDSVFGW